ncbi:Crp/Fnr family transcriptional regulator [Mucilaginibacter auburnensis]|uniref:CRP-like cAMP-binding protein n=1 Tax=Mucilaginibacter auburnensis TaxID=1457233 RepID=A0A2H9VSK3_9SPHI|nr:Crp/Fnr family transcriptional regulator [Mucilaginibacter auburnensis]PJJ83803.1 CRP-like cAMP-binding protein [Mucilaginibacter auburnensis]
MPAAHPTTEELSALKAFFNKVPVLPDKLFDELLPKWKARNYKRKTVITTEGEVERYLYFICEGVQRCFSTHNNKEFTTVFTYPFSFGGVVDSFLLQQPAKLTYESLTTTRLLYISYHDLFEVVDKHAELEKWMRIMLSHTLSGVLVRNQELSMFTAVEKLSALFARSPHLFNLIPDKYIASYIGVEKTTLSKMMNNIKL